MDRFITDSWRMTKKKEAALAGSRGHYDNDMYLSIPAKNELCWWIKVVQDNNNNNVHLLCAHQRSERSHDTY